MADHGDAWLHVNLPPPPGFPEKTEIPMFLNLRVSNTADGDFIVVKFIEFLNAEKINGIKRELMVGEPLIPQ